MKFFQALIVSGVFLSAVAGAQAQIPPAAMQNSSPSVIVPGANAPLPPPTIISPPAIESPAAAASAEARNAAKPQKNATHHSAAKHHRKKKSRATRGKRSRASSCNCDQIRAAQTDLEILGYNPGPLDGVVGHRTRAAIKTFQRDQNLKITGKLDTKTYDLLVDLSASNNKRKLANLENGGDVRPNAQPNDFYAQHPDYYGYTNREYANPTQLGSPQTVATRFGDMQISDQMQNGSREYFIYLNGQPVFHAEGQPAAINLSRIFNLDSADAIIITSYAGGDAVCPYRHYLLIVRLNSNGVHEISNCTRAYEAYAQNGGLFISFPDQRGNGWSSGDTWRYENGTLQKL